jgi:hypothetical protein
MAMTEAGAKRRFHRIHVARLIRIQLASPTLVRVSARPANRIKLGYALHSPAPNAVFCLLHIYFSSALPVRSRSS